MIVIIGNPLWRASSPPAPAGRACAVALAAVARGARVELVGRVGEDAAGEALLIALAKAGVGHVAVLRDAARPTPVLTPPPVASRDEDDDASLFAEPEPVSAPAAPAAPIGPRLDAADIDLAVKYLTPSGVMVVTDDVPADALTAAVAASAYAQMRLVVLLASSVIAAGGLPAELPDDATVLAAPDEDDGAFDALVGAYAAALESGADPAQAFAAAQGGTGWEPAPSD